MTTYHNCVCRIASAAIMYYMDTGDYSDPTFTYWLDLLRRHNAASKV